MRTKEYTKEQILQAAFDFVDEFGIDELTARNLAKQLGSSTQVIYNNFFDMTELKEELFDEIKEYLRENYLFIEHEGFWLRYIHFAKEHANLYRAFRSFDKGRLAFWTLYSAFCCDVEERIFVVARKNTLESFAEMYAIANGLAEMTAEGLIDFDDEKITRMIYRVKSASQDDD